MDVPRPSDCGEGSDDTKAERLVRDAIYALQKAGPDSKAARLRRAILRD